MQANRSTKPCLGALLAFSLVVSLQASAPESADFGSQEFNDSALIGMLYDFKQTQQREKVPMDYKKYYAAIEDFIESDFDESTLSQYFRATKALYTTQIFIPHRSARDGPKAFAVEDLVKPKYWLIHYKGQVIPPKAGNYQFAASADGFIVIAVNGKTLLIKHNSNDDTYLKQFGGRLSYRAAKSRLRLSLPFSSDGVTPIDLDVLIGDAGGEFNAFLLYSEVTKNPTDPFPVFQLSSADLPPGLAPETRIPSENWKGIP